MKSADRHAAAVVAAVSAPKPEPVAWMVSLREYRRVFLTWEEALEKAACMGVVDAIFTPLVPDPGPMTEEFRTRMVDGDKLRDERRLVGPWEVMK